MVAGFDCVPCPDCVAACSVTALTPESPTGRFAKRFDRQSGFCAPAEGVIRESTRTGGSRHDTAQVWAPLPGRTASYEAKSKRFGNVDDQGTVVRGDPDRSSREEQELEETAPQGLT